MANKQPTDKCAQTTLQRGKACLRCRSVFLTCHTPPPHRQLIIPFLSFFRKRKMVGFPLCLLYPTFHLRSSIFLRNVTVLSPPASSAHGQRSQMHANTTMARVRLALRSCARLSHASNDVSANSKIQSTCPQPSTSIPPMRTLALDPPLPLLVPLIAPSYRSPSPPSHQVYHPFPTLPPSPSFQLILLSRISNIVGQCLAPG